MSEEIVDVEDTDTDTDEVEVDVDEVNEEDGQEIDWKARALKAESLIVKNKKETKVTEKAPINNSNDSERFDRLELRQDGYSPEVIDKIMELGGKRALSNPILKKSADDLQSQYNAEKAGDIESGPNSMPATKYSKEDLEKMSSEEMEKILPHAQ